MSCGAPTPGGAAARLACASLLAAATTIAGAAGAGDDKVGADQGLVELAERMTWERPVWCLFDTIGDPIYAQCDGETKECLFHRGCFGKTRGDKCKPLEYLKACEEPASDNNYESLVKRGFEFVPAIAEVPPGWARDEAGRVFQTSFDMNRRVWVGGRYAPSYARGVGGELGRAVIETGLRADVLSQSTRWRYRIRALEGEVGLNPLGVRAMAFRFDSSNESDTPLMRFSTFWPEPRRHDLSLDIGWWVHVLGVEYRPRGSIDETHARFLAAGPTWDFWHSYDMSSFLRLRLGLAFDDQYLHHDEAGHRPALTPVSALEADVLLGSDGMHRLTVSTGYELPLAWRGGGKAPPTATQRFLSAAAYETILIAINDQPVTLRVMGEGGYRDDVIEELSGWHVTGGVGLRVNFWTPPPDPEDRERLDEDRAE